MQRYREKQTIQNFTAIFLLFLLLKFVFRESFCPLPFRYAPVTVGSGRMDISLVKHNCPVPLALRK